MLLIVVASISRVYYEDHTAPEDKIRFWKRQGGNCLGNCLAGPSRSNEWGDTLLGGPCWLFMTVLFASLGLGLLTVSGLALVSASAPRLLQRAGRPISTAFVGEHPVDSAGR